MEGETIESPPQLWFPTELFNPFYRNYAVLITYQDIPWTHQYILPIWEKALLTVTINDGTKKWVQYLEDEGIDVFSSENNKYVPQIIITNTRNRVDEIRLEFEEENLIEKLAKLGSFVIYMPNQDSMSFVTVIDEIRQNNKFSSMMLKEIYIFGDPADTNDHGRITETLVKCNDIMEQVIIITRKHYVWLLSPGSHKIYIPYYLISQDCECVLSVITNPTGHVTINGLQDELDPSDDLLMTTITKCEVKICTETPMVFHLVISPDIVNMSLYEEVDR
ncbi:thiamin pyrophosphokinase 1 [Harpegnathos saltator]|uniref:Uncharacterized protein n=1 Tax=Harpegnathos saltator TaxID=610380 RepID=E2BB76_HARSA|nr:thiamin pyrophosphokinase 1 [Harpegnathos saltator]EFN87049.1 hypothetical protein EAI_16593 [Harpegnathos saltator]